MKITNEIATSFNISETDLDIIIDIVNLKEFPIYHDCLNDIECIFGREITPSHYAVLGYIIGYLISTAEYEIIKIKQLKLWQRAN